VLPFGIGDHISVASIQLLGDLHVITLLPCCVLEIFGVCGPFVALAPGGRIGVRLRYTAHCT